MRTVGTHNEATRLIWLEDALRQIPAGSRILDAGAGEQRFRGYCAHLDYVSQDFGAYDGTGDLRGLQTGLWDQNRLDIVSDITAIPEPSGSFDAIMCIEVFEHLPDPLAALREFSRLLRKDGWLILSAPFCSLTHFAPYYFASGYSRYYYEKHLPDNGFSISDLHENGNYFEYIAQEIRRVPWVAEKYANAKMTAVERLLIEFFLRILQRLSARDQGSSQLLHFGCMIRATRC